MLKNLKREIVEEDNILDNGMETLISKDRYNIDSFEGLKKDVSDEGEKVEETLNNFLSENDLIILKRNF